MSNVLIIEADTIVRNLMIGVLSAQGYRVLEAATIDEALALCHAFAHEQLDLLITGHDNAGRAAMEKLLASCANTKVLHISGWPFAQMQQALLPGSSFLKKPFTPAELLLSVNQLLNPRSH